MTTCKQCGSELKLVPAGFSHKTNKNYDAFWSCPNRCKQVKSQFKPLPDAQNSGKVNVSAQEPMAVLADMVSGTLTKEHFDARMDAMATYLKSKLG